MARRTDEDLTGYRPLLEEYALAARPHGGRPVADIVALDFLDAARVVAATPDALWYGHDLFPNLADKAAALAEALARTSLVSMDPGRYAERMVGRSWRATAGYGLRRHRNRSSCSTRRTGMDGSQAGAEE